MTDLIATNDRLVLMKENTLEINSTVDLTQDFHYRPDPELDPEISREPLTIARVLNIQFQISAIKEILF